MERINGEISEMWLHDSHQTLKNSEYNTLSRLHHSLILPRRVDKLFTHTILRPLDNTARSIGHDLAAYMRLTPYETMCFTWYFMLAVRTNLVTRYFELGNGSDIDTEIISLIETYQSGRDSDAQQTAHRSFLRVHPDTPQWRPWFQSIRVAGIKMGELFIENRLPLIAVNESMAMHRNRIHEARFPLPPVA